MEIAYGSQCAENLKCAVHMLYIVVIYVTIEYHEAGIFSFCLKDASFAPLIYFPSRAKPEAHLFLSGEAQG